LSYCEHFVSSNTIISLRVSTFRRRHWRRVIFYQKISNDKKIQPQLLGAQKLSIDISFSRHRNGTLCRQRLTIPYLVDGETQSVDGYVGKQNDGKTVYGNMSSNGKRRINLQIKSKTREIRNLEKHARYLRLHARQETILASDWDDEHIIKTPPRDPGRPHPVGRLVLAQYEPGRVEKTEEDGPHADNGVQLQSTTSHSRLGSDRLQSVDQK